MLVSVSDLKFPYNCQNKVAVDNDFHTCEIPLWVIPHNITKYTSIYQYQTRKQGIIHVCRYFVDLAYEMYQ